MGGHKWRECQDGRRAHFYSDRDIGRRRWRWPKRGRPRSTSSWTGDRSNRLRWELSRSYWGQSLKVSLCAALGQGARLLLFDEPTAGLDPVARNEALRQIHAHMQQRPDVAVVLATHILEDLEEIPFTHLLVLQEGKALNPSGDGGMIAGDADIRGTAKRMLLGEAGR